VFAKLGVGKKGDDRHTRRTAVHAAIYLGWAGAHGFYPGDTRKGWSYVSMIPVLIVPMLLAWFDAVRFLWVDRAEFDARFSSRRPLVAAA
jgi:TM2 domain-containing membrane protein YozV